MSEYHTPVLLRESVEQLNLKPDGIYVDVTFGGGGHSREILRQLTTGRLLVFDQDQDAVANAEKLAAEFPERSFTFIDSNFRNIGKYLRFHGVNVVDGLLADLGVSSHQFNEGDRGFSTRFDGDLDMRMDQNQKISASDLINSISEKDLIHLLSMYGEVRNARTLASQIIQARSDGLIETSGEFKEIVQAVAPKGKAMKYLAQVYQALRIEVNDEMGALKELLRQCPDLVAKDGRLVVISYHSLEDRMVKNFIQKGNIAGKEEKDFYGNLLRPFDPVNRKLIIPSEEEVNENNRARSAKMRVAQRNQWR